MRNDKRTHSLVSFFLFVCVFLDKEDVTEAPAQQQVKHNTVSPVLMTGQVYCK